MGRKKATTVVSGTHFEEQLREACYVYRMQTGKTLDLTNKRDVQAAVAGLRFYRMCNTGDKNA